MVLRTSAASNKFEGLLGKCAIQHGSEQTKGHRSCSVAQMATNSLERPGDVHHCACCVGPICKEFHYFEDSRQDEECVATATRLTIRFTLELLPTNL